MNRLGEAVEYTKNALLDAFGVTELINEIIDKYDLVEEKHGEWIKMSDTDGYYYCCNICGEELPRYMTESPSWDKPYPHKYSIDKTNFCPNCGAKMRIESDIK